MADYGATSSVPGTSAATLLKSSARRLSQDGIVRSKILLLGLRRSGKTSIQQVLFNNLPPKQTFYLEPTMRIMRHTFDTIIPLEIWDCPGNITVETLGTPLSQFSTLIFVIDIRDLYNQPISKLVEFIAAAYQENPQINFEIFVHKSEKLQEDDKLENFRQIHERVSDRLLDLSPDYEQMPLNFHLTSVYDHTLHDAFSRVLHKLINSLPYLEELLNVFCANSQSPKAFLFDVNSRLYIATDASPVDTATHNLCCDYLQMLNSFGLLYKSVRASPARRCRLAASTTSVFESGHLSPTSPPAASSITPRPSILSPDSSSPAEPSNSQVYRQPPPISSISTTLGQSSGKSKYSSIPSPSFRAAVNDYTWSTPKELFYPSASTTLSASTSVGSVTPMTTLTYHLVTPHLALLALLPSAVYEGRRGIVEYNAVFFREGVREIEAVEWEGRGA